MVHKVYLFKKNKWQTQKIKHNVKLSVVKQKSYATETAKHFAVTELSSHHQSCFNRTIFFKLFKNYKMKKKDFDTVLGFPFFRFFDFLGNGKFLQIFRESRKISGIPKILGIREILPSLIILTFFIIFSISDL